MAPACVGFGQNGEVLPTTTNEQGRLTTPSNDMRQWQEANDTSRLQRLPSNHDSAKQGFRQAGPRRKRSARYLKNGTAAFLRPIAHRFKTVESLMNKYTGRLMESTVVY